MKRSPLIAIILGLVLALYIYTSSVRPSKAQKSVQQSIAEQVQEAISDIQQGESPEAQMKGVLKMRDLALKYPNNPDLQWNMGLFSMQSGQYEKAVTRFQKVIELDNNRLNAYMQLALSYSALKDTSSARQTLNTIIEMAEGDIKDSAVQMLEELN
jgi:tetratricopeptide (TPR) repeat protein